jgi:hypothetical protein
VKRTTQSLELRRDLLQALDPGERFEVARQYQCDLSSSLHRSAPRRVARAALPG